MNAYWGSHPNKERLVFHFNVPVPDYALVRTDRQVLTLEMTHEKGIDFSSLSLDFSGSRLFSAVSQKPNGVVIRTRTPEFGYVHFVLEDQQKLVVDLFADRFGGKWQKPAEQVSAKKTTKPEITGKLAKPGKAEPEPAPPAEAHSQPVPPRPSDHSVPQKEAASDRSDKGDVSEKLVEAILKEQAPPPRPIPQEKPTTPPASLGEGSFSQIRAPALRVGPEDAQVIRATDRMPEKKSPVEPVTSEKRQQDTTHAPSPGNGTETAPGKGEKGKKPSSKQLPALGAAKHASREGRYGEAAAIYSRIAAQENLDPEVRERVLYELAEMNFLAHQDNIGPYFDLILSALQRALNEFPNSKQAPHALLRLGQTHLLGGNEPEARGYFNLLRAKYPNHADVPRTYMSLGDHLLSIGEFNDAADAYQHVLDTYPKSEIAKDSAVGLAKALWKAGFYDQSFEILQFIKKRWPGYYLENPDILQVEGVVALYLDKYDRALTSLWTKYNLTPEAADADLVLARLGDAYLLNGNKETARIIYKRTILEYPGREGALIAKMRLAEEGIFDEPTLEQMSDFIGNPAPLQPEEVYKEISQEHAESPLAAVAQLKLAMWYLFKERYEQALEAVADFRTRFPLSDLLPRAEEVGREAFAKRLPVLVEQEEYAGIQNLWREHNYLEEQLDQMDVPSRLGVALSFWRTGKVDRAVALAEPVLHHPRYTDQEKNMAFELLLALFTEKEQWLDILAVSERLNQDFLRPQLKSQLSYAVALAHENLGQNDQSHSLWKRLATDANIDPVQQAFAYTFLARHAFSEKEYKKAHGYAQEGLSRFLEEGEHKGKIKECLDLLIVVSERTGRTMEALKWAKEYENWITREDPDWPAFHYRVANLYRAGGDTPAWRQMLEEIIEERPGNLYAKMARADLNGYDLQKRRRSFR